MFWSFVSSCFSKKRILGVLISIDRLMRRPPDSAIQRQFLKESEIKLYVGIVVIVLSKF